MRFAFCLLVVVCCSRADAQDFKHDKFRQLGQLLPTPNGVRTASGAPGQKYWQQRADYVINVELDDVHRKIIGKETITYHNNSPHELRYLWLQLDPNIYAPDSDAVRSASAPDLKKMSYKQLESLLVRETFDGSVKLGAVTDGDGKALKHRVVKTNLRIDLPKPLRPGKKYTFSIAWSYRINDTRVVRGRTGFELFKEDGNAIYEMAQWFPRMCAYTDYEGWQHKQYLGRGEFTLEFGDYLVRITVPEDHIVGSTGVLQNPDQVLTAVQRQRLKTALTADRPVFVVTPQEAKQNQASRKPGKKTWEFAAKNVRDFAFASSRKFIWDAWGRKVKGANNGNPVLCMSFYPNEGEPLWSKYSTQAVAHTVDVYSKFTVPYPYPVAISVNGPVGGMEYPMICFNGPRPEKDGTYSKATKYRLISVIIHEVGHNWFPMIINSDERQWTWMDEGLNTYVQFLAEQEWEPNYPSWRGEPNKIIGYMTSSNQVPIMTNSEAIKQFGNNAYAKPATALNVLRESVMGRELFDFAFKEYSRRWAFKRPTPADFFRTMEDASGIDLDWFWRGWFYTTDHCNIGLKSVRAFRIDTRNPDVEKVADKTKRDAEGKSPSDRKNEGAPTRVERYPELKDFYNDFDALDVTESDRKRFKNLQKSLTENEKKLLAAKTFFYVATFENKGGLVMPIRLRITHDDGSKRELSLPPQLWRRNVDEVSKLIISDKPVKTIEIDPRRETADSDRDDNYYPPRIGKSRFQLFKQKKKKNEMQKKREEAKQAGKKDKSGK